MTQLEKMKERLRSDLFKHVDRLSELDRNVGLAEKFEHLHNIMREHFPFVVRISCSLYDPATDLVKTFLASSQGEKLLVHYQAKLSETNSLKEIVDKRQPRVVNDMAIFRESKNKHTQQVIEKGYRASYTLPMYRRERFVGFLFIDADESGAFTEEVLPQLDPFVHLIMFTVLTELTAIQTLLASVKVAHDMTSARDDETGAHLNRMSRYARLIALKIADKFDLTDEYIERIFVFSPLHDIGKITIPDRLLFKPDRLSEEEYEEMKTHTTRGRELVDSMLQNFELETLPNVGILRNITELHHEAIDGSGYPHGYSADKIPIEARIVAVADVFDALTSKRPYKEAWSVDEAFTELQALAGKKLDPDCVAALTGEREEVEAIQRRFQEDPFG